MPSEEQILNKSLDRALRVIETMSGNQGAMKLQDIAERTGIPESTVLRILTTLILNKYAQQDRDTRKYFLTLKLSYIGNQISARLSIRDVVRPYLIELSEICGESACLAMEQDAMAVYIDFVEGPDSLLRTLHHIGRSAPLHCTGVGKNLFANYSAEAIDRYIENMGLNPLTENSIRTREELIRAVADADSRGYAVDDEECEKGVRCVAAPIHDVMGKVIASISVTGPASRLTKKRINEIRKHVVHTAKTISGTLTGT